MSRPSRKVPAYGHHKASGQARVRLDGKDHYLGAYGTAASRQEYDRVVAEWLAAGRNQPAPKPDLTVTELIARYKPTPSRTTSRAASRPVRSTTSGWPSSPCDACTATPWSGTSARWP